MKSKRIVSIDILKIMCIIMVVILHLTSYGVKDISIKFLSIPYWFIAIFKSLSIVGVNCFVLISGYFLCQSDINYKRILPLWIQVELYSIGIYLILLFVPGANVNFSVKELIRYALPILTNQYWFFTYYVLLIVLAPMLNLFIKNVTREQLKKFLSILLIIFSIVPTFNIFNDSFGANGGYSVIWFIILYLIASYIRLHGVKQFYGMGYVLASIFLLIVYVCGDLMKEKIGLVAYFSNLIFQYNSIVVLFSSVVLFLAFLNCKSSYNNKVNKCISYIAGASFAVYLIHDNSLIRHLLWDNIVNLKRFIDSPIYFILWAIFVVVCIFVLGIMIEAVRKFVCDYVGKKALFMMKRIR